jgi:hypothetical protein
VDGTARQTATNAIYAKVNSWMTQIESQTSTVAKERMAHDLIINNTVYEDADDANYDQSAASVFLKGQSVCAGYAEAFEFLMNGADIHNHELFAFHSLIELLSLNQTRNYLCIMPLLKSPIIVISFDFLAARLRWFP